MSLRSSFCSPLRNGKKSEGWPSSQPSTISHGCAWLNMPPCEIEIFNCILSLIHRAPSNLLRAISHLRGLATVPELTIMATTALAKRERHLHVLSQELVIFHLFNESASNTSREALARVLESVLHRWTPGEFLIDLVNAMMF